MVQPTPASRLTGLKLPSLSNALWEVVNPVVPLAGATGSNFSVGYLVRQIQDTDGKAVTNGREAFCKAMDFSRAMSMADPAQALLSLTQTFLFERSVLEHCRDRDIRRVIRYLDTGTVQIPGLPPPINVVQYIIFEKAEGDLRGTLSRSNIINWAWKMRCLHNLSSAVSQMHANDLVHQDIKPSNILQCGDGHKLADLGRASRRNHVGPYDTLKFAGDPGYEPPESCYSSQIPNWNDRLAMDMFLVGEMAFFLVTQTALWPSIRSHLDEKHWPSKWPASFAAVLPYYRAAFDLSLDDFAQEVPDPLKEQLVKALRELCEPDPTLRGHPMNRPVTPMPKSGGTGPHVSQYSLERYVSLFNLLATKAEIKLSR